MNKVSPRVITKDDIQNFIELKLEGFENEKDADTFFDLFIFWSDNTIDLLGTQYYMYEYWNILVRIDIVDQIGRLMKRGYSFDYALEYIHENDVPETMYDSVSDLIGEINQCSSWEEKVNTIDKIKRALMRKIK